MKQSFSLIEILIAITIFTFIVLSLYKVIDIAKIDIDTISQKVQTQMQDNHKKSVLMEDFLESKEITIDKQGQNSLVKLITYNTYHNPLYINILYILHKGTLYRVESLKTISEENINSMNNSNIFVDIVYENLESFFIEKGKNNDYFIYIKSRTDNKEMIVSIPYCMNKE